MITLTKNGHPFQNIKDIAVGANHTLALDSQFLVFSWGNGQGGRLGHGDETGENIPKEIVSLRDKKVKLIEAGEASSACISIRNELYIWGVGLHGRLGTGQTNNILSPSILEDLKD
jgi:E3 ubiquitin-protein ligase HERC2